MGIVVTSFVVIFLMIASAGLLIFYRQAMVQRMSGVISPDSRLGGLRSAVQSGGLSVGGMIGELNNIVPKSQAEVSVSQQRLIRAGFRRESAVRVFGGAKFLVPAVLCLVAFASGISSGNAFFTYFLCAGLGYLAPDFWLGRKIKSRQKKIQRGLPDVLDLLVICIEAGLSVDQATKRAAEELKHAQPDLSDELDVVVLEQRAGRPRSEAWQQFAGRTAVPSVRSLVTVLVQSEQLGASIAKTLRVHSDTLRTQRRQYVEEQAAKTTIKLIFPLVFFIFPSLFLVTLGPEVIIISESFAKYFNQ